MGGQCCRTEAVGVCEPGVLGGQIRVLAGVRLDLRDLRQAEPQQVGLLGSFSGPRRDLGELCLDRSQRRITVDIAGQRLGDSRSRVPVQCLALPRWTQHPLLVALAVHADQLVGQLGQHADRNRSPADVGA